MAAVNIYAAAVTFLIVGRTIVADNTTESNQSELEKLYPTQFSSFLAANQSNDSMKTSDSSNAVIRWSCFPPGPDGWTWDKLLITLIGTPMAVCTFLFNFITLLAFLKHRELRGEPSNWYIIHLAFCDMFIGLHAMPSSMIADVFPCYPFPLWVCRLDRVLIWLVPQQSGTLVDLIAYDRMLMIVCGANYARRETMRVVQWKIAGSWLYNLVVFGLPNFLYLITGHSLSGDGVCIEEIFQIAWFSGFIGIVSAMVPTLICGIIYVASAYLLKRRTELLAKNDALNYNRDSLTGISSSSTAVTAAKPPETRLNAAARAREKREAAKRNRAFRFMAFMATTFLVCWFPSGIMIIIYTFSCTDQDVCKQNGMRSILQLTFYLFLSNSIIDPILYPFLMPKFRKLTIRMLTCGKRSALCSSKRSTDKQQQQQHPLAAKKPLGGSGSKPKRAGEKLARINNDGGKRVSGSVAKKISGGGNSGARRAVAGVAAARLASPEHFPTGDYKIRRLNHIDSSDDAESLRKLRTEGRRKSDLFLSSDEKLGRDDESSDDEEDEDDVTPDITSPEKMEVVWKKRQSWADIRASDKQQALIINGKTGGGGLKSRRLRQSPSHERFLSCIRPGQSVEFDYCPTTTVTSYANGASGSPMIVELHTMSTS